MIEYETISFHTFFRKTVKVFYVLDIYAILFLKKNFIAKYIKDDSASNIYSFCPDLVDLRKTQYFQAFATYVWQECEISHKNINNTSSNIEKENIFRINSIDNHRVSEND